MLSLEVINYTFYDNIICMSDYSLILLSASEWKVPTTFIYGSQDWMNYQGAQEARKSMKTPCEILRVPQVLHPSFLLQIRMICILASILWNYSHDCRLATLCS